jgi:hypothetical protein
MKLPARIVALVLPFLLTACFHKTHSSRLQPYAPPLSTAPKPTTTAVELPPPALTIPSQPLESNAGSSPQEPPKPPVKHRRSKNKNAPQPADTTQQAASESSGVSAIGQLSSGDPTDQRQQAADSIAATERGLNGIGRTLSDPEQKIADHIREFLKQARVALASGDVDGASTLAAKAKVLLSELAGT